MQSKTRRPGDGSKIAGAGWHIPAKELHHWWPRGLSKFWKSSDGLVSRLSHTGEILRLEPEKFGAIANGHAIKLEGPWNGTIEPIFAFADSNIPGLVASILKNLAGACTSRQHELNTASELAEPYPMSAEDYAAFSEAMASLVLRSPEYRNRILLNTNYHRKAFGLPDADARDGLIPGNIHQWYPFAVSDFQNAFCLLLFSETDEFIFGEGYLNNVMGTSHTHELRAVLPLTPELAVIVFYANGITPPARVCSLRIKNDAVQAINELTQVYSKSAVFFRSQRPSIVEAFSQNKFLQRPQHWDRVIEEIIFESGQASWKRHRRQSSK